MKLKEYYIKKELNQYKELEKHTQLLDNYVITSTTNLEGIITNVSQAFCKISGYKKDELIGKSHNIIRSPEVEKTFFEELWNNLENNNTWQGDIKNLKKNGQVYWLNTIISSIIDENGNKIGYTSLRVDITDKKKLEEKNLELNSLKNTLSNAVHMANLGTWELDVPTKEFLCSDIFYNIFGIKIGSTINFEFLESLIYPEDLKKYKKSLNNCIEKKTHFKIEYRINKKGEVRKVLAYGYPLLRNNTIIKIVGVIQDITDITKMQEELEVAQRVSNLGHYHYNLNTSIYTCSKQVDKIFGIEEDAEKVYESWLSIIYKDDKERIEKYFQDSVQKKEKFDCEYRIVNFKTKEIKWVHALGEFSYDEKGNAITLYGTIQDITERKNYEDSLKQALYIFENTYDSILITDENANIININNAFEKTTGYTLEEVKGLNPRILKSGFHDDNFYKKMWKEINEKGFWSGEIRNHRKSGIVYDELLTLTAIYDKNNQVSNYIGIFTDISKQKKQDRLLLQQARTSAIGEMIENIAHQWRQPLSVISTIATGLQLTMDFHEKEEVNKDELYKSLESINSNTQYLSKTIDDFRTFFKSDLEERKTFSFQTALSKVKDLTKDAYNDKFINIVEAVDRNEILIKGNMNLLIQSLINIFNNAKDVLSEKLDQKEEIRYFFITTEIKKDKVILYLKDNAGGISKNNVEKVFDPYFTTKHESIGTGLGLYMTRQIITEQLNGRIEFRNVNFIYENKNYTGAEFKITLKTNT